MSTTKTRIHANVAVAIWRLYHKAVLRGETSDALALEKKFEDFEILGGVHNFGSLIAGRSRLTEQDLIVAGHYAQTNDDVAIGSVCAKADEEGWLKK